MRGTHAATFAPLDGWQHLVQSIRDIVMTPIGSRVLRRDYGSQVPNLIDRPINEETRLDFFIATAEALDKWEPRVRLERVQFVEASEDGRAELDLVLTDLESGETREERIAL